MDFKVSIAGTDPAVVRMSGKINENADLGLIKVDPKLPLEIDLVGVTAVNSLGLRSLRHFFNSLQNPVIHLSFCPRVVVDQLVIVRDLLPDKARVISFYVPFFLEETEEVKNVLFTRGKEYSVKNGQVTLKIPQVFSAAGKEMEIDVVQSRYFSFLEKFG